jgi:murein L,D-transpeptidase YcbB/YkuD
MKKDVLPGIAKGGSRYLAKKGLRVYTRKGKQVNASSINAGNYRKFMIKQPPGEDNALGDVKFNFPNPWDIYLHDTPHRDDFPKPYRAKSSGCIRVEKPREFAEFILRDIDGKQRFDQYTIDSIIQTRKTRWEILKTKIPVHIVYLTAMEDSTGNHVRLVQDIYSRDAKLLAMLRE